MREFLQKFNPDFDYLPIKEIKQIQFKKIKKILKYSYENSNFYKKLYKANKVDINKIKNFDDFRQLPIITKEDLRKTNWLFPATQRSSWIDISVTSGTTGECVYLPWTRRDFGHLANITFLLHKTGGIRKDDVVQITYPLGAGMWIAGLHNWLGLLKIGACSLRFGPGFSDAQIENMLRLRPTVLLGAPSFLIKLGLLAKEKGLLDKIKLRKICASGENILTLELKKNTLGKKLIEAWNGVDVRAVYGASEGPICGIECDKKQGYHIPAEYFYLEILNYRTYDVLKPGERGLLVMTTLNTETMPLIRYALGDISFELNQRCSCGRTSPRLGPILGRIDRLIKIKGLLINPDEIGRIVSMVDVVKAYYIECWTDSYFMDQLRICVAVDKNNQLYREKLKNFIREKIKSNLKINVEVVVKPFNEVNKIIAPLLTEKPYHKPLHFFDLRKK